MTPKPRHSHLTTLDFALLRGVIEEMPLGIATTRGDAIVYANASLERTWGAKPGGLDGKQLDLLLGPETMQRVRAVLGAKRIFDDRVGARGLDGREIVAELHVERYTASAGVGSFLLVRDVTHEAGALGRLVEQLGGALFRVNVGRAQLESMSASIFQLAGVDARTCLDDPAVLTELVAPPERERLRVVYERLVRGDVEVANAELRIVRRDGTPEVLHVQATGRRDIEGTVRQIEGVITRATRAGGVKPASALLGMVVPSATAAPSGSARTTSSVPPAGGMAERPLAPPHVLVELTHDLMREVGELMSSATGDAGALNTLITALTPALPDATAELLSDRIDSLSASVGSAGSLCRRVRRALSGRTSRGAFVDVLENVRTAIAPLIGEHSVLTIAGNAGGVTMRGPLDTLVLVLVQLGLRAFRLGGLGLLRIEAHRRRPGLRAASEIVVEIAGEQPVDNDINAVYDAPSGLVPATPRPPDADRTSDIAAALLAEAGGYIETDEWTMQGARVAVVLVENA